MALLNSSLVLIQSYWGGVNKWIRYQLVRRIFAYCGKNVNVERRANFGSGRDIMIGDNSGLGTRCNIPSDTIIGNNVMMAPDCHILPYNHRFDSIEIPMCQQGALEKKQTVIEDDVWIGMNVTMTPGRHISKGTIVGTCCVLTKDFPEYSVVGGNPSKLIKSRLDKQ
jgi:maltose O-acetyltransferase